jgi:hypothetical protein
LHSTQPKPPPSPSSPTKDDNADDLSPAPLPAGKRTNAIYAAISTIEPPTGQISSDQTGRFPVTASTGMKYVLVVYDYNSNAILAEPLLNRGAKTILAAYTKIHTLLVQRGLRPQLQRLDNEASDLLKQYMTTAEIDYQLVPPGIHHRNPAVRAI